MIDNAEKINCPICNKEVSIVNEYVVIKSDYEKIGGLKKYCLCTDCKFINSKKCPIHNK